MRQSYFIKPNYFRALGTKIVVKQVVRQSVQMLVHVKEESFILIITNNSRQNRAKF